MIKSIKDKRNMQHTKKGILKPFVALSLLLLSMGFPAQKASAQDAAVKTIKGTVYDNENKALPGANVSSLDPPRESVTDKDGKFSMPVKLNGKIIVSYVGFQNDTLTVRNEDQPLKIVLDKSKVLHEVTIVGHQKTMDMDMMSGMKTEKIGQGEFLKAACCNLSESFETIPSVDVGFTDAVSGYKQIKMLGLAGANTSFTRENIPEMRGLASITGLTFTPGAWVSSMQLSKGAGSVVNGYEGTAGQINVEIKKPIEKDAPVLFLNGYQSIQGRSEGNLVYNHKFKSGLSTNLLLHGSSNWLKNDNNHDGFLDNPLGNTFIGANRWFWFGKTGFEVQGGIKGVFSKNTGGQKDYSDEEGNGQPKYWGYQQDLKRLEAWTKIGKVFPQKTWKSMGLQLSGAYHEQESLYGLRHYDGRQQSFYANYIYQSILGNTNHVIKGGASFSWDRFRESFTGKDYDRKEIVPGVFGEYSYKYLTKFNVVAGLRADYHNLFGFFLTPRLHIRYAPKETTVFRVSAGRAQRTANIFAENAGYMAGNRSFIPDGYENGVYHFQPEVAWNMGINFTQKFMLNYRDGSFSMDYYYTDFTHQVVVDIENPHEVHFYNLAGKSFAHSFQAQLDYEPVRMLDVRLAYRYYNVQTDYEGKLKEKPFVAAHRAFMNLAYTTRNNWKFDYTLHWTGPKRIPDHFLDNRETGESYSPSFVQMNGQISKSWKDSKFELYLGAENLTNYMQPDLILDAQNPFGNNFDASMVWGPGMGRNIYLGFRMKLGRIE
jgi:hypothetical protein